MSTQRHLPVERESITKKLELHKLECYVTVGFFEDGTPGELFLTTNQMGTLERGLFRALAIMISLALQHGVPMRHVTEKLKGITFEPSGLTKDPEIPMVKSLLDYLGQWLERRFPQ